MPSVALLRQVAAFVRNGWPESSEYAIGESSEVIPAKESFVKAYGDDQVRVTLLASLASRDKKGRWSTESAGWYALCNGRVVVRANKTDLTGWGEPGTPLFHSKYRGFIGIAFFYSNNPHLLPWTTTKRGLNRESKVYQEAKNIMIGLSRPVLKFLDHMYPSDVKAQLDERSIAQKVLQIDFNSITEKPIGAFKIKEPVTKAIKTTVKVQYDAEEIDLNRIRKCMRKRSWSASKIGKYTFEHFLKKECPE